MCACVLGFPGGSAVRIHQPMQETHETWVQSLDWKDPLEAEMTTHSRILAWRIPWTEKPYGLHSLGLQRVRHDWAEHTHTYICIYRGLPWWLSGKRICLQCKRPGFNPWVGKIPWRRKWQPTPVYWPGEFHGFQNLRYIYLTRSASLVEHQLIKIV